MTSGYQQYLPNMMLLLQLLFQDAGKPVRPRGVKASRWPPGEADPLVQPPPTATN